MQGWPRCGSLSHGKPPSNAMYQRPYSSAAPVALLLQAQGCRVAGWTPYRRPCADWCCAPRRRADARTTMGRAAGRAKGSTMERSQCHFQMRCGTSAFHCQPPWPLFRLLPGSASARLAKPLGPSVGSRGKRKRSTKNPKMKTKTAKYTTVNLNHG